MPEKTVAECAEAFFGERSPLKAAFGQGFEPRRQQRELAVAVGKAMDSCGRLVAEAPTGVGKTLAYLYPAMLRAKRTGLPAVVSTHSIALQGQIVSKDAPFLAKAMHESIRPAAAKGRGNYLCMEKMRRLMTDRRSAKRPGPAWLARIVEFAENTQDGDKAGFTGDPSFWHMAACDNETCPGRKCRYFKSCWLTMARAKIADADLVVANHALLFATMAGGGEGAIPPMSCLVIDEAHEIEDEAAAQFGHEVTLSKLLSLTRLKDSDAAREARRLARDEFGKLMESVALKGFGTGPMALDTAPDFTQRLSRLLKQAAKDANAMKKAGEAMAVSDMARSLSLMAHLEPPGWAIWAGGEADGGGSLSAQPVDVSLMLKARYPSDIPIIAASATLAVDGSMDVFMKRTGLDGSDTVMLDSPFKLEGKVKACAAKTLPPPGDKEFAECAAPYVGKILEESKGRAFLLFTSYSALHECAAELMPFLRKAGMTPVVQRRGDPPAAIIDRYLKSKKPVLFGTSGFWTGVDIPGEALSAVVVMKLPFPSPSEPLEAAREAAAGKDYDGFLAYAVPRAVTKLRQGLGRLVRRDGDGGIMAVMDSRVFTKPYGKAFLDAIPVEVTEVF